MSHVGLGLFMLAIGLGVAWMAVMQIRTRDVTGENIFDLAGAVIPPLRKPMFWASTIFLGLLAAVALTGAVINLAMAAGYNFD